MILRGFEGIIKLLISILLNLIAQDFQFDSRLIEQFFGQFGAVIVVFANHPPDTDVNNHLGADITGSHLAVEGGAVKRNAELGGLADGVLLGVSGADAVAGDMAVLVDDPVELVADFVTVRLADRGADIAGGE